MSQPIYLDNNATTRIAPEVLDAMLPFLREQWGNPSSIYGFGRQLAKPLELAREKVAALINAEPREIIFTSGGTESNNSALQSDLDTRPKKRHLVTTAVEHSATIKFCAYLKNLGFDVTVLPVDADGRLDLKLLEQSIRSEIAIVSVMTANNETGVLFPVEEIAAICRSKDVLFHTDAVQAPGKMKIDVKESGVDFLSLSAHKLHAPKGVGVLYVKRSVKYHPYIIGGGQEYGRRGGTENVAGIVGFGRAAELALAHLNEANIRIRALRDKLENGILKAIEGVAVNGSQHMRLPNTSNLSFEGIEAEGSLLLLDEQGICASSGSACTSGSLDPSHVLLAMGCDAARARPSVRFSLGIYNTEAQVEFVLKQLPPIIAKLRAQSSSAKTPPSKRLVV
jgi:cysteine desulfurase